jgi:hypothetical protein
MSTLSRYSAALGGLLVTSLFMAAPGATAAGPAAAVDATATPAAIAATNLPGPTGPTNADGPGVNLPIPNGLPTCCLNPN